MKDSDIIKEFYASSENAEECISCALKRLEGGEPCAYIIGEWYFWKYTFKVNRDCLIPRPDTEILVEHALKILPKNAIFADLCTGSGCIALTLLAERRDLICKAFDISGGALEIARENANALGVSSRVAFTSADLLSCDPLGNEKFDAIISNPPYIVSDVIKDYPSLAFEPQIALDGGFDGLDFYRHFIGSYAKNISENGHFIFEIGFDQGDALCALAKSSGFSCEIKKDYGGNDRVAILTKTQLN